MERNYGNIGLLDIRSATEKTFEDQFKIGNIGVVIYSKKTAPLLKYVNAGNIGTSIECDEDVQIVQGKTILSSESLGELASPLRLLVMGKLVVQDNLTKDALLKGIDFLHVSGKILCPSDLLPTLQTKAKDLSGKIETYPSGFRLIEKNLHLDNVQVQTFQPNSKLAVFGDVYFHNDISIKSIKNRLAGLYIRGNLMVPEGLIESIHSILHPQSTCQFNVIPDGYEAILEDIQVNPSDLTLWTGAKLYFAGSVRFSPQVNNTDINQIQNFIARKGVICRENLLSAILQKCDRFKTQFTLYKDRLFYNEGQTEISKDYLCEGDGVVTIVNTGMLSFDSLITQEDIRDKIHDIRNSGLLSVAKNKMGAIQDKLIESHGQVIANSNESDSSSSGTGNIGILKL